MDGTRDTDRSNGENERADRFLGSHSGNGCRGLLWLLGLGGLAGLGAARARTHEELAGRHLHEAAGGDELDFSGVAEWGTEGAYTNAASGPASFVGGGVNNGTSGEGSVVGGGDIPPEDRYGPNTAGGPPSVFGGGERNETLRRGATVGGGQLNRARGAIDGRRRRE